MSLAVGATFGPYEITGPVGAGGMGEVYRARDTRLDRTVAIKVLPEAFGADPDRLARFEREARTLAALNHPNVAQIFGIVDIPAEAGRHAIAMEFVDGEDLSQRLQRGPLPIDEAIAIAVQIANGLEAAHEQGIIHRDLKPANVKVRDDGTVKVLDFGLAKALEPAGTSGPPDAAHSPTITSPAFARATAGQGLTQMGVLLGTAAYMSPEQARGRRADRRADLWAFGCVLFEMLSGRPAFGGETITDVLAAVVSRDPDWSALPAATPHGVRRLLERCLDRDAKRRLADAGEARYLMEEARAGHAPAAGEKSHRRPYVLPGSQAVLFVVGTSRIDSFDSARIEVLTLRDRTRRVVVEGGTSPTYVSTGHIIYARDNTLVALPFDAGRLSVSGAPVTVLDGVVTIPQNGVSQYGISQDGSLVYVAGAEHGRSAPLVAVDRQGRRTPLSDGPPGRATSGRVSPDGRWLALDPDAATQQLTLLDLGSGAMRRLTHEWDNATPVWTPDGRQLVFRTNRHGGPRNLYSMAMDGSGAVERLSTADGEQVPGSIHGNSLLYEQIGASTLTDIHVLSLETRQGQPVVQSPAHEAAPRFSPDGAFIAYQSDESSRWEVYVQPFPSDGRRWQISIGGGVQPTWQAGGREIIYRQGADIVTSSITRTSGIQATPPVRLFTLDSHEQLIDIAPDGRFIVAQRPDLGTVSSLALIVNWFADLEARLAANGG